MSQEPRKESLVPELAIFGFFVLVAIAVAIFRMKPEEVEVVRTGATGLSLVKGPVVLLALGLVCSLALCWNTTDLATAKMASDVAMALTGLLILLVFLGVIAAAVMDKVQQMTASLPSL